MPIVSTREYRNILPFLIPTTEKQIDSEFYVEGYATTFDKPYLMAEIDGIQYFEVIERNALDEADMTDVIMQYDHKGKVLARTSNRTLIVCADNVGIKIAADLSKSKAAKELHEEIQNELVTKMSWCFTVGEESYNRETRTRTITKVKKVYDVSAVSIPASADTEIMARSFAEGAAAIRTQELRERKKMKLQLLLKMEEI